MADEAVVLKPVSFDPFAGGGEGGERVVDGKAYPVESPGKRAERAQTAVTMLKSAVADSQSDREAAAFGKEIENAQKPVNVNRGAQIASERRRGPAPVFPLEGDKKQSVTLAPVAFDPFAGPDTGVAASDFAKSGAAGALSGAGMIAQGGGELLARGINMVGGKLGFDPQARAINPMQGWINDLLDARTPAAKKAEANSQISGELLKPETWNFGNDPSVAGIALQGMNAIGQFAPNLGVALVTAGASIPAQLAIGATVGGLQALGGGAEQERAAIGAMSHEELMVGSKLYAELVGRGVPQGQAKEAVAEAAALGGGLGNAIPSAGEGAFENFLIGALTKGKIRIPSLGAGTAGRVATGVLGGGAMGGAEEAVEQAGQNMGSNVAIGGARPIGDDTLQQFVMGMIAEGAAGGGAGVLSKSTQTAPAAATAPQAPAAAAPAAPVTTGAPAAAAPPAGAVPAEPAATLSPIDQARVDAQTLKAGGDLPGADEVRTKNATLLAVYGENAAVRHVIDAPGQFSAIGDAMLMAAPTVERVRSTIKQGDEQRDITQDILGALDELERIKASGKTVAQVMAHGVSHDVSYEGQQLIQFLDENANNPKRIASFLENYLQEVENATGVPSQVRGRAFDIIAERQHAKKKAEQEKADELQRDTAARAKAAETAKAREQAQDQNVKAAVSKAEAAGGGLQPGHKTAMEVAFANAKKLKEKNREKSSAKGDGAISAGATANPAPGAAKGEGPAARIAGAVSKPAEAHHGGNARSVREGSNREGAGQGQVNRGADIASELTKGEGTRENPIIASRPKHITAAAARAAEQPSSAQKEAGNYAKGHFQFAETHPLAKLGVISIETAKGKERVAKDGGWSAIMPAHYGHLQIADGNDGDKADVTIGDDLNAKHVYVIDQIDPATKQYDETKSMVGFSSQKAAEAVYVKSFTDGKGKARIGAITEMTTAQYVARAQSNGLKAAVAYENPEAPLAVAPEDHEALRTMAEHSNWEERGGRAMRAASDYGPGGDVVGRTAWVGKPDWAKGLEMTEAEIKTAVEKAIAGKPLGARQRTAVEVMQAEIKATRANLTEVQAAVAETPVPDEWSKLSEVEKDDELDKIFGADTRPEAAGQAPAGEAGGAQAPAQEVGPGRPALELQGQTPAEVAAQHAQAAAQAAQAAAESVKAAVDEMRGAFTLTGSKRAADEAAARGQQDLLATKSQEAITDFGEKIGGARKDTAQPTGASGAPEAEESAEPGWRRRFAVYEIANSMRAEEVGRWAIRDTRVKGWRGEIVGRETFATKEAAEKALPLLAVAQKHRVHMGRPSADGVSTYTIWREVTDRKRVQVVPQEFPTREDAMQYMAEHAAEIIETKTAYGEEILAKPEKVKRIGEARRAGPATAKMFADTFGFRGVEFGNWNNQEERQEVMNHAYDGLLDLAEVLSLPPKALSLNGELALAFGARGQGLSGAKAHYERDYGVINLTKMSGAGSLAHEWFHAMDHYLGRQDTKAKSEKIKNELGDMVYPAGTPRYDYASHGFRTVGSQVREDLRKAYTDLIQTMFTKAEQYVEDTQKAEKFVGDARERLAKAIATLRVELTRGPEQLTYMKRNNKPASDEQLATFDQLAEKLVSGQDVSTAYRPSQQAAGKKMGAPGWMAGRHTNDTLEAMSAVYKAVRGRSGFSAENHGPLDTLRALMVQYSQRINMLKSANAGEEKTKRVPTSYAMESKKIDQGRASDYWTTEHEMAARAFSAYVEDKIAEQGNRSDFLAYGADNNLPWYRIFNVRPFPEGKERVDINTAFDKFVGELKTKETDSGVAMFSRQADNIADYKLQSRPARSGQPLFWNAHIGLGLAHLEMGLTGGERVVGYGIYDAKARDEHGQPVKLGVARLVIDADNKVSGLHLIEIFKPFRQQGKGWGETVIASLLAHNGTTPMRVFDIQHHTGDDWDALPFWKKMGARLDNYASDPNVKIDGTLTLRDYLRARGEKGKFFRDGQAQGPAEEGTADRGGRGRGAESIVREAGQPAVGDGATPPGVQPDAGGAQGTGRGRAGNAGSNEGVGLTPSAVRQAVEPILSKWGNAPEVIVLGSMAEAPEAVRSYDEGQRSQGAAGTPEAFYWGGKVYLVAGALQSAADAQRALFHETLGHVGLRGAFGDKLNPILDRVSFDFRDRVAAKAAEYGLDVKDAGQRRQAAEEVLAELAQTRPQHGLVKRLIAAIRQFLRDIGVDLKLSDADLVANYIAPARRFVERGRDQAARETVPAFSRAVAGTMPGATFASARDMFNTVTRSDRTLNRLISKFNTPYHIAETHPEFKPVYEEAQDFNQDVSRVVNETADFAPDLLPRIESFADFKKSAPSNGDVSATANVLYAGTLWGGGSPLEGRVWTDEELRSGRARDGNLTIQAFDPVNESQIKLYRQALASVGHSLTEHARSLVWRLAKQKDIRLPQGMPLARMVAVADELAATQVDGRRDRMKGADDETRARAEREIQELEAFRKSLADIQAKTEGLIQHGYFPAMRFGQYAVNVQTMDENGKWKEEYFGRFETQAAANLAKAELQKEYPNATSRVTSGVMNDEAHKLFQGLNLDALELFSEHMRDDSGKPISADPIMQEYFRVATTERSSLKRQIHRKGTPGFSRDVPRALAQFTVSNATSASRNYHAADMLQKVQKIKAGDLQAYATRYVRYLQDPQEESPALRGFLANYYILGSIAFGAVNMTQPVLMTAPYLSQHTSWANAMAQLGRAAKDLVTGRKDLSEEEKAVYAKAAKAGIVSPQEIHQIRAESRASMLGDSPLFQKLEAVLATKGVKLPGKLLMRKAAFVWGSIYSMTEQFNRGTTFLASYRIAKANKDGDPYAFAKNAVDATQGVYARSNRPEVSRGAVGSLVMTFKQFNISYLELAKRLYTHDKKSFAVLMLTLMALAGAEGLPFAEDIEDLIDTIGQWLGYSTNAKKTLRKLAIEYLGSDIADVMLHGASAIPGIPIDVANRMGMHNIIPGSAMLKTSEPDKTRDLLELLGPAATLFQNAGHAATGLATGQPGDVKGMLPSALQNVLKAAEMVDTGTYRDAKGRKVMNVDAVDAFSKMIGFQPAKVARETRLVGQNQQDIALHRVIEDSIASKWAHGMVDKEPSVVSDAVKQWKDWNAANPEMPVAITGAQIERRVKELQMSREQRFVKSAPKEIRGDVARDLRQ